MAFVELATACLNGAIALAIYEYFSDDLLSVFGGDRSWHAATDDAVLY